MLRLIESFLDSNRHFGEERVGHIWYDQADGMRALRAQASGTAMVNVTELAHRTQYTLTSFVRNQIATAQYKGRRRARDTGVTCNFHERHRPRSLLVGLPSFCCH